MTTGNKIIWKRGEIAPKEQFLLFSTLFYIYISNLGVKIHIHLLNVVVQFIIFLTLSTLICRGTDISKCFSKSLGIRDNESRLYIVSMVTFCKTDPEFTTGKPKKSYYGFDKMVSDRIHHPTTLIQTYGSPRLVPGKIDNALQLNGRLQKAEFEQSFF